MPKDMSAVSSIAVVAGHPVELPSGQFVADAAMTRAGLDLRLTAPDGHTIVIEGYFAQDPAPDIVTADGGHFSPQLVASFLPPEHVGQYAAAGQTANDASPAGKIVEVVGEASIVHADGTRVAATVNALVYQGDVIETSKTGAVNILFADDTTFAISESARLSIDQYVYDSAHHSGTSFFSMLQGVFIYTGGLIDKSDPSSVRIETPVGSIGMRGTVVAGHIFPAGQQSTISILEGAISVTNSAGTTEMSKSFDTISVSSYQQAAVSTGPMDAQTFHDTYRSISTVANDTFSHFSAAVAAIPAANAPQPVAAPVSESAPSDAPPPPAATMAPVPGITGAPDPATDVPPAETGDVPPPTEALQPEKMEDVPPPMDMQQPEETGYMPPPTFLLPPPPSETTFMGDATDGATFGFLPGMTSDASFGSFKDPATFDGTAPLYDGTMMDGTDPMNMPPPNMPPPITTAPPPPGLGIGFLFSSLNSASALPGIGIEEFSPVGTVVGNVQVVNAVGAVTYTVAGASGFHAVPANDGSGGYTTVALNTAQAQALFSIDATGLVRVNDPFAMLHYVNNTGFNLTFTATDAAGNTATKAQFVAIRDYLPGVQPQVDTAANLLSGTGGADFLIGNGNLAGMGGADVLLGGNGNNAISIFDANFAIIDGGAGLDTLVLGNSVGTSFALDFAAISGVARNIEKIEFGANTSGSDIFIDIDDVFAMTDSGHTLNISAASAATGATVHVVTGTSDFTASPTVNTVGADRFLTYTGSYNGATVTLVINETTPPASLGGITVTQVAG